MYVFEGTQVFDTWRVLVLWAPKFQLIREKLQPSPDQNAGLIKLYTWLYQGKHCTASGAFAMTREAVVTTNKDTGPELFQMFGEDDVLWVTVNDEVLV